jgi:hypothetical protein
MYSVELNINPLKGIFIHKDSSWLLNFSGAVRFNDVLLLRKLVQPGLPTFSHRNSVPSGNWDLLFS